MPAELTFAAPPRAKPPRHLADLSPRERDEVVRDLGEKPFRAKQLAKHYFGGFESDTEQMTDLPAGSREALGEALLPTLLTPVRHVSTDNGTTRKTLWKAFDGVMFESVLMRYPDRVTLCISSQAGCGMNCPFCATGQAGLTRNLSTAEIVEQIIAANQVIAAGQLGTPEGGRDIERVTNVVFMGLGDRKSVV